MLAMDFFDSKEMVIVEQPFMDFMSKLHRHTSDSSMVHRRCADIFHFSVLRYYVNDNFAAPLSKGTTHRPRRAGVHVPVKLPMAVTPSTHDPEASGQ